MKWIVTLTLTACATMGLGCKSSANKFDLRSPHVEEFNKPPDENRYNLPPEKGYTAPPPAKDFKPGPNAIQQGMTGGSMPGVR